MLFCLFTKTCVLLQKYRIHEETLHSHAKALKYTVYSHLKSFSGERKPFCEQMQKIEK